MVKFGLQTIFKGLWISTSGDSKYIFNFLKDDMTPDQIKAYCSSKLSTINKNLKRLSAKIEEMPSLSTKHARYSAAKYVKRKQVLIINK